MYFVLLGIALAIFRVAICEETENDERGIQRPLCQSANLPNAVTIRYAPVFDGTLGSHPPVEVKTYLAVITSRAKNNSIKEIQLKNQLAIMNKAYGPFRISFKLNRTDYYVDDTWANSTNCEARMKIHRGTYGDLNLHFYSELITETGSISQGRGTFPIADPSADELKLDGVRVKIDCLPGGTAPGRDLGATAVHEIGHWFNLVHPWEGTGRNCTGTGDVVADTPTQHAYHNTGCPTGADSCPGLPGKDNIHNYMEYTDDSCRTQFTTGQGKRMLGAWDAYRFGK